MLGNFIEHCYGAMGRPAVTQSSVWTVYRNVLSAVQLGENPHPDFLLMGNEGAATGALTLITGYANLPFNEEPDGTYYMGGVHGGLGLGTTQISFNLLYTNETKGDSHVNNLNALAEHDEPNVPFDGSSADVEALIVWQFSSDESDNGGAVDEW
jgi:hypothetical protein